MLNPKEKAQIIVLTGKVLEHTRDEERAEKDLRADEVCIDLYQHDQKKWENFQAYFLKRQEELSALIQNLKS